MLDAYATTGASPPEELVLRELRRLGYRRGGSSEYLRFYTEPSRFPASGRYVIVTRDAQTLKPRLHEISEYAVHVAKVHAGVAA